MDERYDMARAIRDREFRYVRNYSPPRPWGQHYWYPFKVLPSMRSWHSEFVAGRCNVVQARYWGPKPSEELYAIGDDPFEIENLADDPRRAKRLAEMRQALRAKLIAIRDAGFIPEAMVAKLAGAGTIYDYAQSAAYPVARVVDLADKAASRDPAALPELTSALHDPHPVIRYWGAIGCLVLREKAVPAKKKLLARLDDPYPGVRVAAAEALGHLGESDRAFEALASVVQTGEHYEILAALNALDFLHEAGKVPLDRVQKLLRGKKFEEPCSRVAAYLLRQE
jgi:hypothetical protein